MRSDVELLASPAFFIPWVARATPDEAKEFDSVLLRELFPHHLPEELDVRIVSLCGVSIGRVELKQVDVDLRRTANLSKKDENQLHNTMCSKCVF